MRKYRSFPQHAHSRWWARAVTGGGGENIAKCDDLCAVLGDLTHSDNQLFFAKSCWCAGRAWDYNGKIFHSIGGKINSFLRLVALHPPLHSSSKTVQKFVFFSNFSLPSQAWTIWKIMENYKVALGRNLVNKFLTKLLSAAALLIKQSRATLLQFIKLKLRDLFLVKWNLGNGKFPFSLICFSPASCVRAYPQLVSSFDEIALWFLTVYRHIYTRG